MKFDSTMYLMYSLKKFLGLDQQVIENCLRILNGFVIEPNSIHFDEDDEMISFITRLPGGNLEVFDANISKSILYLRCGLTGGNDISIRLKCSIHNASYNFAVCVGSESRRPGIYYFNSSGGKKEKAHQYGLYSYFDGETLGRLRFYANKEKKFLDSLIDVFPSTLNTLGYMPDNIVDGEIELENVENRTKRINSRLKDMSCEYIEEMIDRVYVESSLSNSPISI